MSTDAIDKTLTEAQRLLDCDGPHLRKWQRDDPNDFLAVVHRVATLALAPRAAPEPYVPPEGEFQSTRERIASRRTPPPRNG